MNRKRNVGYIKPEDPPFLKALKKEAGYDDTNHKFDELADSEKDFVDDEESEQPQVVVLMKGDLTAEEAEVEKKKLEKLENEAKADLSQRVIFKSKHAADSIKRKRKHDEKKSTGKKKQCSLLSFDDEDED